MTDDDGRGHTVRRSWIGAGVLVALAIVAAVVVGLTLDDQSVKRSAATTTSTTVDVTTTTIDCSPAGMARSTARSALRDLDGDGTDELFVWVGGNTARGYEVQKVVDCKLVPVLDTTGNSVFMVSEASGMACMGICVIRVSCIPAGAGLKVQTFGASPVTFDPMARLSDDTMFGYESTDWTMRDGLLVQGEDLVRESRYGDLPAPPKGSFSCVPPD